MTYTSVYPIIVDLAEIEQLALTDLQKPKEPTTIKVVHTLKDITEEV